MINQTSSQYDQIILGCKKVFLNKNADYGTSWRVMRIGSITDQIFIKAKRIRTIEEKASMKVDEGIESEFKGIINYCIIGLIQMELVESETMDLSTETLTTLYDKYSAKTKMLMEQKNHDYGEAWRDMQVSTFTDMLLMRVLRIRQLIQAENNTTESEGIDSNLMDMINYSVFALIQLSENR